MHKKGLQFAPLADLSNLNFTSNFLSKPIFDLLQTLAVCNSAVKQCQGKYLGVWLLVALRLILRLTHYTACSTFFQDINSMG